MKENSRLTALAGGAEPLLATALGGLDAILKTQPSPSATVLVLANSIAAGDRRIFDAAVDVAFDHVTGDGPRTPHHDILDEVLRHTADPFALLQTKTVGDMLVALNPLREVRPRREADSTDHVILKPFDDRAFGFWKVPQECFWIEPTGARWYFNAFPYIWGNFVVVPELRRAQELVESDIYFAWTLYGSAAEAFPRAMVGYNSLGAYSSVNEIHFQVVLFGAGAGVPADLVHARELRSPAETWEHVNRVQQSNRPFNLVFYLGRVFLIERLFQGREDPFDGNTGPACWEMGQGVVMTNQRAYDALTQDAVLQWLSSCVPAPALVPVGR